MSATSNPLLHTIENASQWYRLKEQDFANYVEAVNKGDDNANSRVRTCPKSATTRVRSRHVNPLLNPVGSFSQWKLLKKEDRCRSNRQALIINSGADGPRVIHEFIVKKEEVFHVLSRFPFIRRVIPVLTTPNCIQRLLGIQRRNMDTLNIPEEGNKVHKNVEENSKSLQVNVEQNSKEIHINIEEHNKEVPSEDDSIKPIAQNIVSSLKEELAAVPDDGYVGFIYKISEKYRKLREESYTPRVVSIGPLHHGKSRLQAMEASKLRCLKYFLIHFEISLIELSECATSMESDVRSCYEHFNFNAEEFSKMILLDGIFLIQHLVYNAVPSESSWKESDIMHDMLLLENQLPLFFVAQLFSILAPQRKECYEDTSNNFQDNSDDSSDCFQDTSEDPLLSSDHSTDYSEESTDNFGETYEQSDGDFEKSFLKYSFKYFQEVGITKRLKFTPDCHGAWHLVHFLVNLHVPSKKEWNSSSKGKLEYNRSASELKKAGVHFSHEMGGLFEVSFDKVAGLLKIPQLTVNDTTETFFRNLIAFEQFKNEDKFITSYIIFMDSLINTAEDVELLVNHKIIHNLLGENQLVADLFNNLYKEVIEDQRKFYFADTCKDLDEYSKNWYHQWKSSWFKWKLILKYNYFSNPWSVISFIAAGIVIILTIVQTVCSILGL
ncbi:hypothetical protein POM88_019011 [Heracleum sosnowskyi]|uniref:Uncharacterized protein n=1 Tax=Heracleum sosnowskyi TaxID=360622 RepID=A0AAD8ITC8_9APIA|nr:hypothetical protein POM88_019011 [Heracleum sosnowskyi]